MVKKTDTFTLSAQQIHDIYVAGTDHNKINAIKALRGPAYMIDLLIAKQTIEGEFALDLPKLKVGQKVRVSPKAKDWSYEGRIYETDGDNFKLIQDKVTNISYNGVGYNRSERASSIINVGWNLEILAD